MDLVDKLWAIEQIKQLKARYFRFADTRDPRFFDVFTSDVVWTWYGADNVEVKKVVRSREEFRTWLESINQNRLAGYSVHHGHMPEIEIIDEDNARGIWAMQDIVSNPGDKNFVGYGHYHEEYRRDADGEWRISKTSVTRLHVDEKPVDPLPPVDASPAAAG